MSANTPKTEPALPVEHHRGPRARMHAGARVLIGVTLLACVVAAAPVLRPPREPAAIQKVLGQGPHAGDCEQCHTMHGGDAPTVYPNALVGPDDNTLCQRCHVTPWDGGSYATDPLYRATGHGSSPLMVWPGNDPPARIDPDAPGKCLNCHDSHGWSDAAGLIPHLAVAREEKLCFACHDGHPSTLNVQLDFQKPYRHPAIEYTGRHAGPDESQPTAYGVTPVNNRHAECEDCHNAHVSRPDGLGRPLDLEASATTLGVSRVAVLNGTTGSPPAFTFIPGSDTLTTPLAEYQLCFKCHSSWTTQPSGKTDLAMVLNPANPSYHPVEAQGRNLTIDSRAFTPGWKPTSFTRCGDCHGSDFGTTRGPHGSIYPAILKKNYVASPASRMTTSDEICFSCHAYETYADPRSPDEIQQYSRFNGPRARVGHAAHVGEHQVPCYACHVTHGSASMPFLLVKGRLPGLTNYVQSFDGGTCSTTCHGTESYTVNYAR